MFTAFALAAFALVVYAMGHDVEIVELDTANLCAV